MTVIRWYGDEIIRVTREHGVEALHRGASHLLSKANETVPYLEGILAASGNTSVDEGRLLGVVSYSTPYAVKQHEDITLRHSGRRRALWLKLTMQEQAHRVLDLMASAMRGAFR